MAPFVGSQIALPDAIGHRHTMDDWPQGIKTGRDQKPTTNAYGYLLGTVMRDGSASFAFQSLSVQDLLAANQGKQPEALVRWCFDENSQAR
jgi:hypothetical protein